MSMSSVPHFTSLFYTYYDLAARVARGRFLHFCQWFQGHWNTGALETWWAFSPIRPTAGCKVFSSDTDTPPTPPTPLHLPLGNTVWSRYPRGRYCWFLKTFQKQTDQSGPVKWRETRTLQRSSKMGFSMLCVRLQCSWLRFTYSLPTELAVHIIQSFFR